MRDTYLGAGDKLTEHVNMRRYYGAENNYFLVPFISAEKIIFLLAFNSLNVLELFLT